MSFVMKIVYFVIDLIVPLYVGYLLAKNKKGNGKIYDKMLYGNIWAMVPLMGILSFWSINLSIDIIWLPIIGVIMQIIPALLGILGIKRYKEPSVQGSYIISVMLSNRKVAGSLSVFILFGEVGYAYAQFVLMLSSITVYMICFPIAQYFYRKQRGGKQNKVSLRKILINKNQLPIVGIFIGIILNMSGIKRPIILGDLFHIIIHISAWMSLIPVGYSLNFGKIKKYKGEVLRISVIKFIITPLVTFLIAKLVVSDPIMIATIVILACSPVAINAVVTAKVNKINVHLTMASFIGTMIIYLIFVYPAILLFFNH
ncbi:hypothetical protein [Clostridium oceanicum]|uniref:Transporter n=1 Tax=Clostridium oceanicum TaxID=1543 RepID=A0ABP3ULK1_9CLOT